MKPNEIDKAKNPLLKLALPALQRAAKNAREQAIYHNTKLIIWKNDQIVRLSAEDILKRGVQVMPKLDKSKSTKD